MVSELLYYCMPEKVVKTGFGRKCLSVMSLSGIDKTTDVYLCHLGKIFDFVVLKEALSLSFTLSPSDQLVSVNNLLPISQSNAV